MIPVGLALPFRPAGIATAGNRRISATWWRVDVCVPLLATHAGAFGANAMPQGFTKCSFVEAAVTEPSDTNLDMEKALGVVALMVLAAAVTGSGAEGLVVP